MTDYRPFEPRPQTPGFIYYEPPTGEPQLSNELRVHVFDHGLLRIWARHADRPNYNRTDSAIVDVFPEHAAEFVARLTEALGIDNDRAALAAEVKRLQAELETMTASRDLWRSDVKDAEAAQATAEAEVKRLQPENDRLQAENDRLNAEAQYDAREAANFNAEERPF